MRQICGASVWAVRCRKLLKEKGVAWHGAAEPSDRTATYGKSGLLGAINTQTGGY